jgi:Raf kinase inhibitor-like YbhB/YbcL family protein
MLIALLLACSRPEPDDTGTGPAVHDTAPAGDFVVSLPAATPSDGDALADRCAWELSVDYECYNPNPEVRWENAPAGTAAFVLVLDDPDAGDFEHWAVVNIPATEDGLDAGISGQDIAHTLPGDAYELDNGFGFTGYLGSCPPEPHVYRWRVWALSAALDEGITRFSAVENQAGDAALGVAETCHIYGPKSSG